MNVRLDLYRAQTHKTTFFVLSKSQLDSPSHFTSNLSPEAVENLKQELSSTKVTLHLDYEQSIFFLGPSSKTRETRKWPHGWLKARHTLFFFSGCRSRRRSRARSLPSLNLKQKQRLLAGYTSLILVFCGNAFHCNCRIRKVAFFVSNQCLYKQIFVTKYSDLICLHDLSLTGPLPARGRCSQTKVKLSISSCGIHHSLFLSALAAWFVLQDK